LLTEHRLGCQVLIGNGRTAKKTAEIKTDQTTSCPFCAEDIEAKAIKCKHCGEWLNDETDG